MEDLSMEDLSMEDLFTCKDCGSHDLVVVHEYSQTDYFIATLACHCDQGEGSVAAEQRYSLSTRYWEQGYLDETHHWEWDESDSYDEPDQEREALEVYCDQCLERTDDLSWHHHKDDDPDIDDEQFYVHCAGCERDIEFGWSHPDRGGRIWPAECADFNPWKSWPEPRYREAWAAKNWLRPTTPQEHQWPT